MTEIPTPEASSASRQKSCHACVKGKRGCDKQQPACSRCQEKNIQCVYAKRTYDQAFYNFDSVELDMSWAGLPDLSSSNQFVDGILMNLAPSRSRSGSSYLNTLDTSIDPMLTFEDGQFGSSSGMQLINDTIASFSQHEGNEQELSKFDYSPMADLCVCGPVSYQNLPANKETRKTMSPGKSMTQTPGSTS